MPASMMVLIIISIIGMNTIHDNQIANIYDFPKN